MQNTAPAFQLDSITIGEPRKKPQAAAAFAKLSSRRISLPAKFYKRKSTAVAPRGPQTLKPVSLPNFDIFFILSLSLYCLVFSFQKLNPNQSINQSINRSFSIRIIPIRSKCMSACAESVSRMIGAMSSASQQLWLEKNSQPTLSLRWSIPGTMLCTAWSWTSAWRPSLTRWDCGRWNNWRMTSEKFTLDCF